MKKTERIQIKVETIVKAPMDKVWDAWTNPEHIVNWNNASDDWYTPIAENDPVPAGRFLYRMEPLDGSGGFDFGGEYEEVRKNDFISYTMDDGRQVEVKFRQDGDMISIEETFEAEYENPIEMQRDGWQAILDNFKLYVESFF